jgi:hypothetical protein
MAGGVWLCSCACALVVYAIGRSVGVQGERSVTVMLRFGRELRVDRSSGAGRRLATMRADSVGTRWPSSSPRVASCRAQHAHARALLTFLSLAAGREHACTDGRLRRAPAPAHGSEQAGHASASMSCAVVTSALQTT